MRLSIILTFALMLSGFDALAFGGPESTALDIVGSTTDNIKIVKFMPGDVELEIIGSTASNITITPFAGKIRDSVNCDDGNPCTMDLCGAKGCIHVPVNCDDGNPCTMDLCGAKGCIHVPVNCDDGNPCTIDLCSANGCVHVPVNCDDGNPCTMDLCGTNGCVHVPVNCDDGNPCTIDSCGANGCVHVPMYYNGLWTIDYCPSCLTHLRSFAESDSQRKTYPWDYMHLGVDAWYGTFWYKNIYMPKWPQI